MSRAERFCQQLSRWEEAGQGESAEAHAWLVGRTGEIELVLALALSDWNEKRVSSEDATQSMSTYLLERHAASRTVFGVEDELDCCCDEAFLTEVVSGETVTRLVPRGRASRSTCDLARDGHVLSPSIASSWTSRELPTPRRRLAREGSTSTS